MNDTPLPNDVQTINPESHIKRMAGSHTPADETFVDLYEHNIRLGSLTRWDWAAPVLSAGTLALGAAVGALVAGVDVSEAGVLVCLVSGVILLACGVAFKSERTKDVREVYEEFDRRLALYDDEPTAKAIGVRLDKRVASQAAERRLRRRWERLKDKF
jgi:hypothetical protein